MRAGWAQLGLRFSLKAQAQRSKAMLRSKNYFVLKELYKDEISWRQIFTN
jgi:hypothetical protein